MISSLGGTLCRSRLLTVSARSCALFLVGIITEMTGMPTEDSSITVRAPQSISALLMLPSLPSLHEKALLATSSVLSPGLLKNLYLDVFQHARCERSQLFGVKLVHVLVLIRRPQ